MRQRHPRRRADAAAPRRHVRRREHEDPCRLRGRRRRGPASRGALRPVRQQGRERDAPRRRRADGVLLRAVPGRARRESAAAPGLRARPRARPRRDGRGLPRETAAPRPRVRDQDGAAAGGDVAADARAVRARGEHAGDARPPPRRARTRLPADGARHLLPRRWRPSTATAATACSRRSPAASSRASPARLSRRPSRASATRTGAASCTATSRSRTCSSRATPPAASPSSSATSGSPSPTRSRVRGASRRRAPTSAGPCRTWHRSRSSTTARPSRRPTSTRWARPCTGS